MVFNFKSLLPYAAGAVTGGVMNQFGATSPWSAAGSAVAGALTNKQSPMTGALQGFAGGGVGAGVGGMMNGGNFMSGLQKYGNSIPGFGGIGTSNPTGMFSEMFTPAPSQSSILQNGTSYFKPNASGTGYSPTSMFTGMGSGVGSTTGSTGTPSGIFGGGGKPGTGMNPMSMFESMLPGMATAGIGSMLSPSPKLPDTSGIKADMQSKIQNSINPQAQQYWLDTLAKPAGQDATAANAIAQRNSDVQRTQAQRDIQQQFQGNQGGNDFTNNSEYQNAMAKMNSQYNLNDQARNTQTQFQYDQQQQQYKQAAATALQGMSNEQLQYYASLADMDAQMLMAQFNIDSQQAQSLKDIASMAGQLMMENAVGANQVTKKGA